MSTSKYPWHQAFLPLVLLYLVGSATAIYEDQAGTFDWYKQYVGRPKTVTFVPGRERIYLSTNQNLLASLQTKSGNIAWRQKYTDSDPLDKTVALHKPALVLAASKGCKHLRAWDALDGSFKWESLVFEGPSTAGPRASCAVAAVEVGSSKGQAVAVAASDKLQVYGASKGDLLWSADLDLAGQANQKHLLTIDDSIVVVAYTSGSSDVHVLTFHALDGSSRDSNQLLAGASLGGLAAVSGRAVAIVSSDAQQLCTLVVAAGEHEAGNVVCQPMSEISPDFAGSWSSSRRVELLPAGTEKFSLTVGRGVLLVAVDASGAQQTHWFPEATAAAPASADHTQLALASAADHHLSVQLFDTSSGEQSAAGTFELPSTSYPHSGHIPHVSAVWMNADKCKAVASSSTTNAAASKDSNVPKGCQLVVLWSDDQLSFVSNDVIAWTREEALASGISSTIIDLPAVRSAAASAQQQSSSSSKGGLMGLLQDKERLKRWVRLQVLSVLVQFKLNTAEEAEEYYQLRQALSDNNLPFRDTNGFRKMIILLTGAGKVFGLHSGDGRILWTHTLEQHPTSSSSSSGDSQQQQYLRLWRRFHDLTHAPQLSVITAGVGSSQVQVLNGHTGEMLEEMQLPYSVDKVIPIREPVHDGAADQFVSLLVEPLSASAAAGGEDDDGMPPVPRVHLVPNTPTAQHFISTTNNTLFFWLKHQQPEEAVSSGSSGGVGGESDVTTTLRGYAVAAGSPSDSQAADVLPVVPAWQVVLPGPLLGLAAKDPAEPVHSYVKVLGDRSLKYNYLNPNLLFVATGSPLGSRLSAGDQSVSVALVNTVTGGLLYHQVHSGCAGPVYAVASENWVVYTMRDVVNLRQQASVIELYDASHHDLSIGSIILGHTQHSSSQSSYGSTTLDVLTQSFYLQHFVKGLSVTQTKQGITTKQLLVQTISDQLYALDKRFLDPRRPLRAKATPEEMEERLLPYNELVLFNTLQYPTQNKQVMNLRGVSVTGAVLESTTLVFTWGTDLFYTRISPALNFDSLQADFSYGLLVVALLALVGGTWFAAYSSKQTMLKAKWQ